MKAYVLFLAFLISCSSSKSGSDASSDALPTSDGSQTADGSGGDAPACDLTHYYVFGDAHKDVCASSLPMACLMVCGTSTGCTMSGTSVMLATCPSASDGGAIDGASADVGGSDVGAPDVGPADAAADGGAADGTADVSVSPAIDSGVDAGASDAAAAVDVAATAG